MIPDSNRKRAIPEPSSGPVVPPAKTARSSSIYDHPRDVNINKLQDVVKECLSQLRKDPFDSGTEKQLEQIKQSVRVWSAMARDHKIPEKTKKKIQKYCQDLLVYAEGKYKPNTALEITLKEGTVKLNDYYLQRLRAVSPVVDRMLESSMKESGTRCVDFTEQDFNKETFSHILGALEDANLPIPNEQALSFFFACQALNIDSLNHTRKRALLTTLYNSVFDLESLLEIYRTLATYDDNPIKNLAIYEEIHLQIVLALADIPFEIISDNTIRINGQEKTVPLDKQDLENIKRYQNKEPPKKLLKQNDSIGLTLQARLIKENYANLKPSMQLWHDGLEASELDEMKAPTFLKAVRDLMLLGHEHLDKDDLGRPKDRDSDKELLDTFFTTCSSRLYSLERSQENLKALVQTLIYYFQEAQITPEEIEDLINHINHLINENPKDLELRQLRARFFYLVFQDDFSYQKKYLVKAQFICDAIGDLNELIKANKDYRHYLLKGLLEMKYYVLHEGVISAGVQIPTAPQRMDMCRSFKESIGFAPSSEQKRIRLFLKKEVMKFSLSLHNNEHELKINSYLDNELNALLFGRY